MGLSLISLSPVLAGARSPAATAPRGSEIFRVQVPGPAFQEGDEEPHPIGTSRDARERLALFGCSASQEHGGAKRLNPGRAGDHRVGPQREPNDHGRDQDQSRGRGRQEGPHATGAAQAEDAEQERCEEDFGADRDQGGPDYGKLLLGQAASPRSIQIPTTTPRGDAATITAPPMSRPCSRLYRARIR